MDFDERYVGDRGRRRALIGTFVSSESASYSLSFVPFLVQLFLRLGVVTSCVAPLVLRLVAAMYWD